MGKTDSRGKVQILGVGDLPFSMTLISCLIFFVCFQGRGTKHYGLIVVGHSLGAGTAAILSFLLRPQYPSLKCFAYSPPGGLLR